MPERAIPRWEDVVNDLVARMRSGEFGVGSALPSTSELMSRHKARSNGPIKKAIDALKAAGVVEGRAGAAVYVLRVPREAEVFEMTRTLAQRVAVLEAQVAELKTDIADFKGDRALLGQLQAELIELYSRMGQPYPGAAQKPAARKRRTG